MSLDCRHRLHISSLQLPHGIPSTPTPLSLFPSASEEQRQQDEEVMARYFGVPRPPTLSLRLQPLEPLVDPASLRTPTSVQSSRACSFPPSTSPVKKDLRSRQSTTLTLGETAKDDELATKDQSKLRVSRERNRLHAQRTRIRKRELLERLTEQRQALADEFELLTHVYDFHATAVGLLRLGNALDVPCVQQLEQMDVKGTWTMEDEDQSSSLKTGWLAHEEREGDDGVHGHEEGCKRDAGAEGGSCRCSVPLCSNGRRLHLAADMSPSADTAGSAGSTAAGNGVVGSKEERERVRRERNRLHARRARLRKKRVLEESQQTVYELQERNDRLRSRLSVLVSSIYGSDVCLDDPDATS